MDLAIKVIPKYKKQTLKLMYQLFQKLLFSLDPESSHELVKTFTKLTPPILFGLSKPYQSDSLKCKIGNKPLTNPIGLAAGFDKNGEMIDFLQAIDFGFLELGSVTALECQGQKKPRIFRLPDDKSLINRMGLPNGGAEKFVKNLNTQKITTPFGINIAKTPEFAQTTADKIDGITDFISTFQLVQNHGDYIVFNLSCPNTNDHKTFEDPTLFNNLAREIMATKKEFKITKPILLKLSPDTAAQNLKSLVEAALKFEFDGFVVSNTTTARAALKTNPKRVSEIGKGGLSGQALTPLANKQLKRVYEIVGPKKILMGVGGIMNFEDLLAKLECGASLFQIYTGFIYEGPLFIKYLNQKLEKYCKAQGVKNYSELVGQKSLTC